MASVPVSLTSATTGPTFTVERFEQTAADRLELAGRWSGVRGRRFVRPTLDVHDPGGRRRRLLALLEHKPWAPVEGELWLAAFPWEGGPPRWTAVELAVATDVVVGLPAPGPPGLSTPGPSAPAAGTPASQARTAEPRVKATPAPRPGGAPEREHASRVQERDAARRVQERDAALVERDEAVRERDAAREQLGVAVRERDSATNERRTLRRERNDLITLNQARQAAQTALARERDAAVAQRDEMVRERDGARTERRPVDGRTAGATATRPAPSGGAREDVPAYTPPDRSAARPDPVASTFEQRLTRGLALVTLVISGVLLALLLQSLL